MLPAIKGFSVGLGFVALFMLVESYGPPAVYFTASLLGASVHLATIPAILEQKDKGWQWWLASFVLMSLIWIINGTSYGLLLVGAEFWSFEQHLSVVRWTAQPIWFWPSGLLVGIFRTGARQMEEMVEQVQR